MPTYAMYIVLEATEGQISEITDRFLTDHADLSPAITYGEMGIHELAAIDEGPPTAADERNVRSIQRSLAPTGEQYHTDDCRHWESGPCTCGGQQDDG